MTTADILALIPAYAGTLIALGALIVSWLAYRRSKNARSESAEIARILAETLRELARSRAGAQVAPSHRDDDEVFARLLGELEDRLPATPR